MAQPKYKIALVGNTLSNGGAEKAQARLSQFLDTRGIEVHHILVTNKITYPYAGKVFNMGLLKNTSNDIFNKLKRLSALRKYLKKENFDYIIDFRVKNNYLQESLIANWVYNVPYIMSIRSFNTDYYFPKNKKKASRIYRKSYVIVAVSKALQKKIETDFGYQNVHTIYNGLDFAELQKLAASPHNVDFPYILGIGRMQAGIKQFDHLIEAYHQSSARKKGIHLVLVGEGEDVSRYQELTRKLNLEKEVHFYPFTENPFPYFKNAYFTALTSKYEGFPNVLIESLALGTPVVSYDCQSGPNEIVKDGYNGLLIKDQDMLAMKDGIDRMVNDPDLYKTCKNNAVSSVSKFTLETVGEQWLKCMKLDQLL